MSGYRDDDTGFDPMGAEKRKLTRTEWVLALALIVVGGAMMARGIIGDSGPSWLKQLGMWPIAIAELLFGWTFLVRAREASPAERFSPWSARGKPARPSAFRRAPCASPPCSSSVSPSRLSRCRC